MKVKRNVVIPSLSEGIRKLLLQKGYLEENNRSKKWVSNIRSALRPREGCKTSNICKIIAMDSVQTTQRAPIIGMVKNASNQARI